jgi:hypothetical protein
MSNNTPNVKFLTESGFAPRRLKIGNQPHYKSACNYKNRAGLFVNCFYMPTKKSQIWQSKIEIKPRQFISYNEMLKFIVAILGDLNSHVISRLDFDCAIPMQLHPLHWFLQRATMKGAQVFETHYHRKTGEFSGFSIGVCERRLNVYQHNAETIHFEVQLRNQHVPIKKIEEFELLIDTRPFSIQRIELLELNEDVFKALHAFLVTTESLVKMSPNDKELLRSLGSLESSILRSGLFMTQKFFKKIDQNYSRKEKYFVTPATLNIQILEAALAQGVFDFMSGP